MKPGISLLLCCMLSASVWGGDMVLRNGRVLKDAQVASYGDDFVNIRYADGVTKVSYKALTDEQQEAYGMTPAEVRTRLDERRKKEEEVQRKVTAAREAEKEEARQLRAALKESERVPRYMQAHDVERMFLSMGELSNIEAEVLALQWNAMEADRVGLPDQARAFRERAETYNDRIKLIRQERKETEDYWLNLEKEYQKLKALAQKKITNLNNKVAQLEGEVDEARREANTERIIVTPGFNPWLYPTPAPVYRPAPPRPVRPKPAPRPNPAVAPAPARNVTKFGSSSGVRPAQTTPARPAKVTPAVPAR